MQNCTPVLAAEIGLQYLQCMHITSKLPAAGTTIFTVMSSLALEYKAINLGQGFPDFMMSPELTALVNEAMHNGFNQYTHMNGYPPLREKLAAKVEKLYGTAIHPDSQITVTPGGTYAIYTALTTVLQPNDEVIVFEPAYDSYIPNILINGGKPVRIALQYPDYSIPWNEVKAKLTDKTRMIILNSPHNPTGMVLNKADIESLRNIVANTNIFIVPANNINILYCNFEILQYNIYCIVPNPGLDINGVLQLSSLGVLALKYLGICYLLYFVG